MKIDADDDRIRFGERFSVTFQRTLRIPDDGREYPLPPGLGRFPVLRVDDYRNILPSAWHEREGYFIPMYQREALWLGFDGVTWKPNVVMVGVGGVNAVSGEPWSEQLRETPQNYLVCPLQPWIDGINAGDGAIRQFVAVPPGEGLTIEEQLIGSTKIGGIQIVVFEPKPGRFPDQPPEPSPGDLLTPPMMLASPEMGLGAGGRMRQKIYPDPFGLETWDPENRGSIFIHIINSVAYRDLTGREPPPTPISARTYTEHGLPWFDLYDESMATLPASEKLSTVKSIEEITRAKGKGMDEYGGSIDVSDSQIRELGGGPARDD
jgi:hypothetical protein